MVTLKPRDYETTSHAFETLGYGRLAERYGVKLINVLEITELQPAESIERELMLARVAGVDREGIEDVIGRRGGRSQRWASSGVRDNSAPLFRSVSARFSSCDGSVVVGSNPTTPTTKTGPSNR